VLEEDHPDKERFEFNGALSLIGPSRAEARLQAESPTKAQNHTVRNLVDQSHPANSATRTLRNPLMTMGRILLIENERRPQITATKPEPFVVLHPILCTEIIRYV
jgi:hypothetical protein